MSLFDVSPRKRRASRRLGDVSASASAIHTRRTDVVRIFGGSAARILRSLRYAAVFHRYLPAGPHRHHDRQSGCARSVAADAALLGIEAPAVVARRRRSAALRRVSAAVMLLLPL